MPTQGRTPHTQDPGPTRASPQADASAEDQRELNPADEESQNGGVEIGDPVPEDNRTIRARGETGEDEDLPDDGGDIERPTSRH